MRYSLIFFAFLLPSGLSVRGEQSALSNTVCPVMPDQPAVVEFSLAHDGGEVFFCCRDCVNRFKADPSRYAGNLPVRMKPKVVKPMEEWSLVVYRNLSWFFEFSDFAAKHMVATGILIAAASLFLLARISCRRAEKRNRLPTVVARWFANPARLVFFCTLAVAVQSFLTTRDTREQMLRLKSNFSSGIGRPAPDYVGAAKLLTAYAWPNAVHRVPQGLSQTYYRGNDERNEKLYQGGRYRTATFRISIVTADGQPVTAGQRVADTELRLRCEVIRAKNTAESFFSDDKMAGSYIVPGDLREASGMVKLKPVRPNYEWHAEGVIGKVPAGDNYLCIRGVWYLGSGGAGPHEFMPHYAMQFAVHIEKGVVMPQSVLWMVATYASPILTSPQADNEWFSDEPIVEIPDGQNVTDPKLLGVDKPNPAKK